MMEKWNSENLNRNNRRKKFLIGIVIAAVCILAIAAVLFFVFKGKKEGVLADGNAKTEQDENAGNQQEEDRDAQDAENKENARDPQNASNLADREGALLRQQLHQDG